MYFSIAQIALALFLIILVLLQQRGTALGSAFGGEGGFYATRRGIQQKLYLLTIGLGISFVFVSLFRLIR